MATSDEPSSSKTPNNNQLSQKYWEFFTKTLRSHELEYESFVYAVAYLENNRIMQRYFHTNKDNRRADFHRDHGIYKVLDWALNTVEAKCGKIRLLKLYMTVQPRLCCGNELLSYIQSSDTETKIEVILTALRLPFTNEELESLEGLVLFSPTISTKVIDDSEWELLSKRTEKHEENIREIRENKEFKIWNKIYLEMFDIILIKQRGQPIPEELYNLNKIRTHAQLYQVVKTRTNNSDDHE